MGDLQIACSKTEIWLQISYGAADVQAPHEGSTDLIAVKDHSFKEEELQIWEELATSQKDLDESQIELAAPQKWRGWIAQKRWPIQHKYSI